MRNAGGSVTTTPVPSSLTSTAPSDRWVKSTMASTVPSADELHTLAGERRRHPLHVVLLVEGDLELTLRGVVLGEILEVHHHRRGRVVDLLRRERAAEQL